MTAGSGDLAPKRPGSTDLVVGGGDLADSMLAGGGDAIRAAKLATEFDDDDVWIADERFALSERSSFDRDACFKAAMRAATEPVTGSLTDLTTGSAFSETVGSCAGA